MGHRNLTQRSRWMAATLATGGVLSHRSAAALGEVEQRAGWGGGGDAVVQGDLVGREDGSVEEEPGS